MQVAFLSLVGYHSSLHLELGGWHAGFSAIALFPSHSLPFLIQISHSEEPGTETDCPIRKKETLRLAKQELQHIEITVTVLH